MKLTLANLALKLNGDIVGDSEIKLNNIAKIEDAKKGDITFLSNKKYLPWLKKTKASLIIVNKDFDIKMYKSLNFLCVEDSYLAFNQLLQLFNEVKKNQPEISKYSLVQKSSSIGKNVHVGNFSVVGNNCNISDSVVINDNVTIGNNISIGSNTILNTGVRVYDDTKIGDNCIIHSNSVIGSDGFGFAPNNNGEYTKTPQIGNVIIGNNVEIGSCTTIDRATIGSTIINEGVKIDNLVQIAHNVEIGKNTVIAAQSGISGSTKIGKNCQIGGQVGFAGHIDIGNNVKINGGSGVFSNIKDNSIVRGNPAFDARLFNRSYVYFKNLVNIFKDVDNLKKH
ncbi:MAG: UDP-3-O-(3-hydroxymyristoyl)glucosamine N-acyltransferase [Bacteroidetes bacterium MED-G13]|nr:MAG: UDP-3-O-(3-hydroxymyristoyl)glucosamine N-acyltransferase [Bacteroidetes bacterium MED-G13]